MGRIYNVLQILGLALIATYIASCNGKADLPFPGSHLGDSVIDDGGGGSRSDIDPGQLYVVTKIVAASSDITSWADADLPFNRPRRQLGVSSTDSQWPFEFGFTYPANNYALTEAHLLMVTSRDASDTEAIFVDGVFTGRPPDSMVSTTSTKVTHRLYNCRTVECGGAIAPTGPTNNFFLDWALTHYKVSTDNTFDINLQNLLTNTALTIADILSDGLLRVVTGDDAIVRDDNAGSSTSRPLLVMVGSTYSTTALTCNISPTYYMKNNYLFVDGNSIAQPAFTGSVLTPFNSSASPYAAFRSVEFYYDPRLPTLTSYDLLNITKGDLWLQLRRANTDPTAIVINGIGIDQDGFDRNTADPAVVESWSSDAVVRASWNTFVTGISADSSLQTRTLNLLSLLGASTMKSLLQQGKLNIAVAGPIARIQASAATSTRTYGVQVTGPELILEGNYAAEICEVPDNPNSPLNGGGVVPSVCTPPDPDVLAPTLSSIQVINITSSSATIQWLSSLETSTSQVGYGLLAPSTTTTIDNTPVTFHSVNITGLLPYKFYQYNVRSVDACGNETISTSKSFRTLR
ncbi:MAG: fibronectin type III domain-containing protein [Bdellovibrionota bacterium]